MLSQDPILNLFIGLALTFGSFSLLTGTIVESLASTRNRRSKTLVTGLGQMLNDTTLQGVAAMVLERWAVNPLLAMAPDGEINAKQRAQATRAALELLVALLLAAGMNLNALADAQQLWVQRELSASLAEFGPRHRSSSWR